MFKFHYLMWGVMALYIFTAGMLNAGAIDSYRIKAEQQDEDKMLLNLPLPALTLLTWDKE